MPPPRQNKDVIRVYSFFKILRCLATSKVGWDKCKHCRLMRLADKPSINTSGIGDGVSNNFEYEGQSGVQNDANSPKRTYSQNMIKPLTQTLSRKGRGKCTSPLNTLLKKHAAFTLAEVLITLGIIGVVAALTMPALIQNHKKSEASARLKKFYSTMQQAILLSENENGSAKQWTKVDSIEKDPDTGLYDDADAENTEIYFNTYLKKYLKYLKTEKDEETNLFKVMLTDGSSFLMRNGSCIDFIFDYNGDKFPNAEGRDRYRFVICPEGYEYNVNPNQSFSVYGSIGARTREQRLLNCSRDAVHCSSLLEYDNWEFKSDYPYKF